MHALEAAAVCTKSKRKLMLTRCPGAVDDGVFNYCWACPQPCKLIGVPSSSPAILGLKLLFAARTLGSIDFVLYNTGLELLMMRVLSAVPVVHQWRLFPRDLVVEQNAFFDRAANPLACVALSAGKIPNL